MAIWAPLPPAELEVPTRRGKFIDIEIFGGLSLGGDIISSNWDGTVPLSLNSKDLGASTGYGLDASAGAIQSFLLFAAAIVADTLLVDAVKIKAGTVASPPLTFQASENDGLYQPTDGEIGVVIDNNETVRHEATRTDFDVGALRYITIPVKTDTGDPSSPQNGDMYVNTQDNKVRVFADSAWRDLATW